ncbi:MAG: GAF domain-containing protein [Bacteroidales bacterium]|nr:GAF domain-containing protein [Bacteroidales bacterium]MBN2819996.1 GAF domain-containing protein [Bacteroidales bacterium]
MAKYLSFKLKGKLLFISIVTTIIIFFLFNTAVYLVIRKLSFEQAVETSSTYANKYAMSAKNVFDYDMGLTKGIANLAQYKGNYSENKRDSIYTGMMIEICKMNPEYISVWLSMELKYFQEGYKTNHGRKLIATVRKGSGFSVDVYHRDMESPNIGSDYYQIKADNVPVLAEPYIDSELGNFMITSLIYPIKNESDSAFAGVGGIDIPLSRLQGMFDRMDLLPGSKAFIISNTGIIVSHTDQRSVGKNITELYSELNNQYNLIDKIKSGKYIQPFKQNILDEDYLTSVMPFKVEETIAPWAVFISIPESIIFGKFEKIRTNFIIFSFLGLLLILGVFVMFSNNIEKIIERVTHAINTLADGNLNVSQDFKDNSNGKLRKLNDSLKLLVSKLKYTANFAQEIEKGNFDADFELRSEDDQMGKALMNMRLGLLMAKSDEEMRREKDTRSAWISDGLARFADILRKDSTDFEVFSVKLISELVKYIDAHVGGIYVVDDFTPGEIFIRLTGSYAYEGEKLLKKRIEMEEGLIGACIKEGSIKQINDIPKGYLSISSSLGERIPKSLIILPLKTKTEIIGALELASLKEFNSSTLEFLEKLAESIAVSFISIKMQKKTEELLEQSKLQTEQMMAQEEEMRLNMEEMMLTQEEMEHKEEQLKLILEELEIQEEDMKKRIESIKKL